MKLPPDDQIPEEEWIPTIPFVVVQSKGGLYDDAAFCAGFQAGEIYRLLRDTPAEVREVAIPFAYFQLATQLELLAMAANFPIMEVSILDGAEF